MKEIVQFMYLVLFTLSLHLFSDQLGVTPTIQKILFHSFSFTLLLFLYYLVYRKTYYGPELPRWTYVIIYPNAIVYATVICLFLFGFGVPPSSSGGWIMAIIFAVMFTIIIATIYAVKNFREIWGDL